ncbi:peptidase S1 [Aurantiacibacter xanthus]|uniref:Peptidase S1 n=2 Tax=Aurantiacibacter xanthus TaxID=1784712 RepID=A0A3A1PDM4_9SPHN|nr:peptidase S1 [Aurantiacibacter xanthus]
MRLAASLILASCLAPVAAQAQNYELEPTYGDIKLTAGFENDPYAVPVVSGGEIDAASLGGECGGFIAEAPDMRVQYEAGEFPLLFGVYSEGDTTLVVNGPDGLWYCDDDSWGDGDPLVSFPSPQSGQYDIWVGSYERGTNLEATLGITEIDPMAGE